MSHALDVVAILRAQAGQEEALAELLKACVAPSRAEPGCLSYALHRDRTQPGVFVFIERWADEAAFAAHQATAHFQALIAGLAGHVAGAPEITVLNAIA